MTTADVATGYALIVFTSVYALLKVSELLEARNADNTSRALLNMFRIVAMSGALILSAVGIGIYPSLIDISEDPTPSAALDIAKEQILNLYSTTMWISIIFAATLFLFITYVFVKNIGKGKEESYL